MYLICKSAHFVLTGPAPVDIRLKIGQLGPLQRVRCRAFPGPAPALFRSFKNTLVYDITARLLIGAAIASSDFCEGKPGMVDRPEWDLRLGYLIHDVSRLRRMMFDRALAPLGITRSQWWVLAFISRKDGLPQTQLANELDVGKVGVGALIDRLESSGFVIRQADPVDRRVKRVYVTKQARGFLEKLRKETDKFNEKIARGIDRKQLEATSDALLAMKRNLLAMSDATVLAGSRQEQDLGKKAKPRKAKKAA
jgi:DNA-binding MarR family transcriptional regulator